MAKPMCQSCGRPLDQTNRGTNADGSPSQEFCNFCYEGGSYKEPDMTIDQMRERSVSAMQEMHFPKFLATMIAKSQLPKLKRWQKPPSQ
jgi:hypothetical protein